MDPNRPTARALAVRGELLLAVGTEAQAERWRGRRTRSWTLREGEVIVPGFIDSHAHLAADAWRWTWVDLSTCGSLAEALARMRRRARKTPTGGWIVARAWDESAWPERRYLTRDDLDGVSRRHPILANRVDGHMCAVNSLALRRVGLTPGARGVDVGPRRRPTGVLKEDAAVAARAAIPRPTGHALARLLERAIRKVHALGITGVHDIVSEAHLDAYQRLRREGNLRIRAYLMPYVEGLTSLIRSGLRTGFGDPWLRLGAIKVFADGSLGARTAALHEPYADARTRGQLVYPRRELRDLLARAHGAGFQLAVHAIGDRGVDVALEAYERVLAADPRDNHRHRIEHCELATDEALDRIRELGVLPSMQPNFVARWSRPGGMYEARLGPDRLPRNNVYRRILRRRVRIPFGSDGMPYGPLYGIAGAVGAPFEDQRIRAEEAIQCYTASSAFAAFAEQVSGILAVGQLADFVVLSGDPRTPRALPDSAVEATVIGGRLVHRRARGRVRFG